MINIASALKAEISRVARKEVRGELRSLKKAIGTYRTEIAALKRRTLAVEQQLQRLSKVSAKAAPIVAEEGPPDKLRYSAKALKAQRQRLNLSARECGLLLGASALVGIQVGGWQGASPREAFACHGGTQESGQEGRSGASGISAGVV